MGFCNIWRSLAWLVSINHFVVSSTVHGQHVQPSSHDTDCPVERLESQLVRIGDQLNHMQAIISSMNKPSIKENCTVDLASYGYDDSLKYGYVKTSGGSSDEVLVLDKFGNHRSVHRGVTLFELEPKTCTMRNRQRFDTWASADDRRQLLGTLEYATTGTIIVGVTADSAENGNMEFQKSAGSFFTRYNMNISGLQTREKFAFIVQKGNPEKTIFQRKPNGGESLRMKIALRGSTTYSFNRV